MNRKLLKDAYNIGENMAVYNGEGKSFTVINKKTGEARMFVSASGELLAADNEINFDAIESECPNFNGCKVVEYWFGRYSNFKNGICALCWTISPDGCYFADEDGFGMEDNDEKKVYCIINKKMEIIVPFQPMNDVEEMLKKYGKK